MDMNKKNDTTFDKQNPNISFYFVVSHRQNKCIFLVFRLFFLGAKCVCVLGLKMRNANLNRLSVTHATQPFIAVLSGILLTGFRQMQLTTTRTERQPSKMFCKILT